MEFDERTQSFTHPTISLSFYKKDLLQEIENYLQLIPDPIKFRHLLNDVTSTSSLLTASEYTLSVLINSRVIFPCIANYEEIRFNFIFLLCEKYKQEVEAELANVIPDVLTTLFLSMYNFDDYTVPELLAKFKLFIAKCVMLGFHFNSHLDRMLYLITDVKNSAWSLDSESLVYDKKINVKFEITLHLILLYFQNGYDPYIDFPKKYVCTEGNLVCLQGNCFRCKLVESIFVTYDFFLKSVTLLDLLRARNCEFRPIVDVFHFDTKKIK